MRRLLGPLLLVVVLAGCSGGGPAPAPTAGPTPTRAPVSDADRAYMETACNAINKYITSLTAAGQSDPQLFSDQAKLLKVAAPILATFGKDMDKAKPPKDMANFHDALVTRIKTIADKAKSGGLVSTSELGNLSKGAPLPPATVRDRLSEAAATVPVCASSGGTDALFGDVGQ